MKITVYLKSGKSFRIRGDVNFAEEVLGLYANEKVYSIVFRDGRSRRIVHAENIDYIEVR